MSHDLELLTVVAHHSIETGAPHPALERATLTRHLVRAMDLGTAPAATDLAAPAAPGS
ncbi:hypothetical protein AB0903_04895 [Streptomyces sp. NPDC048389]|uniref:hypothetical protein n=1 Tax=Streptomyces sp. NPDC048389 TaxID=3154622 RepID=UPI003456B10C